MSYEKEQFEFPKLCNRIMSEEDQFGGNEASDNYSLKSETGSDNDSEKKHKKSSKKSRNPMQIM